MLLTCCAPPKAETKGVATVAKTVATTLTAVKTTAFTTLHTPSQRLAQNPFFGYFLGGGCS